jgi:hypothetical protein
MYSSDHVIHEDEVIQIQHLLTNEPFPPRLIIVSSSRHSALLRLPPIPNRPPRDRRDELPAHETPHEPERAVVRGQARPEVHCPSQSVGKLHQRCAARTVLEEDRRERDRLIHEHELFAIDRERNPA